MVNTRRENDTKVLTFIICASNFTERVATLTSISVAVPAKADEGPTTDSVDAGDATIGGQVSRDTINISSISTEATSGHKYRPTSSATEMFVSEARSLRYDLN